MNNQTIKNHRQLTQSTQVFRNFDTEKDFINFQTSFSFKLMHRMDVSEWNSWVWLILDELNLLSAQPGRWCQLAGASGPNAR